MQTQDLIFAAIDRHREAEAAYYAPRSDTDDIPADVSDAHFAAIADLLATTPTTLPGCAAALQYANRVALKENDGLFGEHAGLRAPGGTFMDRIGTVVASYCLATVTPAACIPAELAHLCAVATAAHDAALSAGPAPDADSPADTSAQRLAPELLDAINSLQDQASFHLAHSPAGALFQLAVAVSDVDLIATNDFPSEYDRGKTLRRIARNLHSAARYLGSIGGELPVALRDYHLPGRLDPHAARAAALARHGRPARA
jgi:hypothetical protein